MFDFCKNWSFVDRDSAEWTAMWNAFTARELLPCPKCGEELQYMHSDAAGHQFRNRCATAYGKPCGERHFCTVADSGLNRKREVA